MYDKSVWKITTDENMVFLSAKKLIDRQGVENIRKIQGGYLAICNSNEVLFDNNFNLIGRVSELGSKCVRRIGEKRGIVIWLIITGEIM